MNQHLNKFPLCLVRYVADDSLEKFVIAGIEYKVSGKSLGKALFPTIEIAESHILDVGLREHEFEHVRQRWWMFGVVMFGFSPVFFLDPWWLAALAYAGVGYIGIYLDMIFYAGNRSYRQGCEVYAYNRQMTQPNKHGGYLSLDDAAAALACPKYRLDISIDQARALLA